jgi:hypothetical protein
MCPRTMSILAWEDAVALLRQFGEMWARNGRNIEDVPGSSEGGQGVYILYDGSTPVYVGKGNIRQRLRAAEKSNRRGSSWDRFSWYVLKDKSLIHDVEVLLIRALPLYLRYLTRQRGHFKGVRSTDTSNRALTYIDPPRFMRAGK